MAVWNSAKNPPKADRKKFLVLVRAKVRHHGRFIKKNRKVHKSI